MAVPNAKVPVLLPDGSLSLPWRRWAENLSSADGSSVTPAEFQALVDLVAVVQAEVALALADAELAQQAAASAQILALVDLGDVSTASSGSETNSSWLPLVDGAEPPGFITDGAGQLITVEYTP